MWAEWRSGCVQLPQLKPGVQGAADWTAAINRLALVAAAKIHALAVNRPRNYMVVHSNQ